MHALIVAVLLALVPIGGQDSKYVERYHATAANTSVDVAAPSLFELEISLERYTTVAERETMQAAYDKGKQDALLNTLQRAPRVGIFRVPGNLSWDIKYAFKYRGRDNRNRIILLTDRNVSFAEAAARPRSLDYPFTVIQLRLDDSGIGDGEVNVAAAVAISGKDIVIEEFLHQPIRLTKVRKVTDQRGF
jgi:hypothetical protein